jgi:hypothetical protein
MKTPNYKVVGIVLLAGVLFAAIVFQIFGSGLISTLPPVAPHSEITAQGYTVEVVGRKGIVFHFLRILPLLGVGLLGVGSSAVLGITLLQTPKKSRPRSQNYK